MPAERVLLDQGRGGEPSVAVCVCLHNYQDSIEAALESAARQTLADFELIVVDDRSDDASAERALTWMRAHAGRFTRCLLLQNAVNRNAAATRNVCMAWARAPFMFLLDADNEIYPRCLARLEEALRESGAALAYPLLESFGERSWMTGQDIWDRDLFAHGSYIDMMALVRREVLEAAGGFPVNETHWDDYELWCRFVEKGYAGIQVPEILGRYRFHHDSKSKNMNQDQVEAKKRVMQDLHPWIRFYPDEETSRPKPQDGQTGPEPGMGLAPAPHAGRRALLKNIWFRERTRGAFRTPLGPPRLLRALLRGLLLPVKGGEQGISPTFVPLAQDRVDAALLDIQAIALYGPEAPALPRAKRAGSTHTAVAQALHRRAGLARTYGLGGFCFYSAWPRDRSDNPWKRWLGDPTLDLGFCLCWDNTDRTRPQDEAAFFDAMVPALKDSRALRVRNRPLLLVRRAGLLSDPAATAALWRGRAAEQGLEGLHLLAMEGGPGDKSSDCGFDGSPEKIGTDFAGSSPELYATWLAQACAAAAGRPAGERMVFIDAWQGGPGGLNLEPGPPLGHANLQATANVLRRHHRDAAKQALIEAANARFARSGPTAVVFHCHYEELLEPIAKRILAGLGDVDVFLSFREDISRDFVERALRLFPKVRLFSLENRGRDMRPFLVALKELRALGYLYGCKIHSKRSLHQGSAGDAWRERLLETLLPGPGALQSALGAFQSAAKPGLLAPADAEMDCGVTELNQRNKLWLDDLLVKIRRTDLIGTYAFEFPAGSMYWFQVDALAGLEDMVLSEDRFEPEAGQLDGTLAHALERVVELYAAERGYTVQALKTAKKIP